MSSNYLTVRYKNTMYANIMQHRRVRFKWFPYSHICDTDRRVTPDWQQMRAASACHCRTKMRAMFQMMFLLYFTCFYQSICILHHINISARFTHRHILSDKIRKTRQNCGGRRGLRVGNQTTKCSKLLVDARWFVVFIIWWCVCAYRVWCEQAAHLSDERTAASLMHFTWRPESGRKHNVCSAILHNVVYT